MKRLFSVFILTFIVHILPAQYFVDNLFVRYQWNELQRYKRLGINNPPLKCNPNSVARSVWLKAEQQLSKHNLALLQENRWEEQIGFYKACIEADSSFCDAYFRLAQCLVERTDWTAVLNLLNLSQRKFPNDPLVYLGLGQAHLYLQFPGIALKNFDKVILLSPSNGEGYLGASMVSYELGQTQKALEYLHESYGKVDGNIEYLKVFEGILLYHTGQTQAAHDLFDNLQSRRPSTIPTDGLNYITINKYGIIDPLLNALVEYYIGLCYAARGESFYENAIYHLKIAKRGGIFIDSTLSRTFGLSVAVDDLKEQLLASYHVESVHDKTKSDPKADEAFENRKVSEAAILFSQRINQDSLNLYSYLKLAECYQLRHDPQKALSIYKVAMKKFAKDNQLKLRLARQLVRVDSLSSALRITQAIIEKHPGKKEPYFQAALILAMMHKEKEAIKLIKKLELEFVGNEQNMPWKIPFILGELYYLSGDKNVALGYFNFAIQNGSAHDPFLNYYYAKCLGAKGNEAEAKRYFYNALALGAIIDKDSIKKFQLIEKQSTPYGEKY